MSNDRLSIKIQQTSIKILQESFKNWIDNIPPSEKI